MRVVIFCGGFGTRMWPASRKSFPKQFYPLIGGKSFFQITYARFRKAYGPSDIFISTEERYVKLVKGQAPEVKEENIIVEPERKDTLAAIGLVATVIEKKFPGEIIFFSWSDHLILDEDKFLKAVKAAADYSKETGLPVSINEEPTFPNVHVGWVKPGEATDEFRGYQIRKIEKFVEKPELPLAKKMFISKDYLFHTGYEAWPAKLLLSYYEQFVPELYKGLMVIGDAWETKYHETILFREYHKFVKDSIDFAVFQKIPSNKRLTFAVNVGWKDSGTWELYYLSFRKNEDDNLLEGKASLEQIESKGNLVIGPEGKLISLIGIEDLVIIDTPDALLVCKMDKTAEVKTMFKSLEEKKPKFVE